MNKKITKNIFLSVYFVAALFLSSCGPLDGSSDLPPSVGSGGGNALLPVATPTISVSSNPTSLSGGGVATITATVKDVSGAMAADGTSVSFSVGDSSFGSVSPTSATTSGGTASVNFAALNKSGSVVITASATVGGVPASGSVTVTITAAANAVTVVATPSSIAVGGTSTITATVTDSTGASVPDLTPVVFSLSDPTKGNVSPGTTSISGGQATATFTANAGATGTVDVIATSLGKTGKATITIANGFLKLEPVTKTVLINEATTITATITDGLGATITTATDTVTFTVSGSSTTYPVVAVNGVATFNWIGRSTPGTVIVSASAAGYIKQNDSTITVTNGQLVISAAPTTILSDGTSASLITAKLTYDGTVPVTGATVDFTITGTGTLSTPSTGIVTLSDGTTYISMPVSGTPVYLTSTTAGTVTVNASSSTGATAAPVQVTVTNGTLTLSASPTTISVAGTPNPMTSTITAMFTDGTNPVDGKTVRFTITLVDGDATLPGSSYTADVTTGSGGTTGAASAVLTAVAAGTVNVSAQVLETGATAGPVLITIN